MVDVEELLDGVPVRLAPAQAVRARGERRRTRQGVGVAAAVLVVAAAVGIGSWVNPAPAPHGASVASDPDGAAPQGENPFEPDGVVRNLKPSDLPKDAALHWKPYIPDAEHQTDEAVALPQAGLTGACNGGWPGGVTAPEQQFTSIFTGAGNARARYRVSEYANADQATDAIRGLGQTLHDCGLTAHDEGARYSGRTDGTGPWLDVSVRRWGVWVGVTEAQYSPAS
ncbi:hypothetical protein [Krasilnikovia sp. MM14-A1004]|uniref:hypothetical protein n=1 Tax=Krasilnikovia sp. MM14-A1004 TaxID=3373541 RepID=UPI00399CA9EB